MKSSLLARRASATAATLGLLTAASLCAAEVAVRVDANVAHQTLEGFGATTISLAFDATDNVPAALRAKMIDAVYNQVHLNMGNLEVSPFESPATALYSPANDDGDPKTLNRAGFNWTQSNNMVNKVVNLAKPFGFDNFWLGPAISETYEFAWAKALRTSNYNAYLEECAEHVAALAIHWRDTYAITPRFMQLWNEPLSGNGELSGGSVSEMADIIKSAGARLRSDGFATMKFVIPAEETEDLSLEHASAILSDPVARPFVGAIAYHPYPYGSTYASVPNILATSGAGAPVASRIMVRNKLRALGAQYGIPVMMVEVSHSNVAFGNFDGMRGRAIQIHDEMVYADASAFFGMNAMWDSVTQAQHYAGRSDPGLFSETDSIVLADVAAGKIYITEMGRAIGQYARWLPRGSVRIDATSDDPLVQVTAFKNGKPGTDGRIVLVAINNSTIPKTIRVTIAGAALETATAVAGEQSTSAAYWAPLAAFTATATGYAVALPPLSVTTFSVAPAAATGPDAGASDATGADASNGDVSGRPDTGSLDGAPKADGPSDTATADRAPPDSDSSADAELSDAASASDNRAVSDAQGDRVAGANGGSGCGCAMPPARGQERIFPVLAVAVAMALRLRSKRRSRPTPPALRRRRQDH